MTTVTTTPSAGPRAKPQSLRAAAPALLALCLTMLVEMIDNSVLNVALPTIGRDLGAGPTGLQWIVAGYSLTFGGLLLVGGTLGDRLGRRRMLLWGLAGFGLTGLAATLVESTGQLIALRALAGAFAALIAPGTMSLLFRLFDDEALRRKAIGVIIGVAMTGFAIGPVLAGLAVTHLPWQALLVVNGPVALIAWLGVRRGIDADDPATLRTGRVDLPGALASVTTLGLALYAATLGVERGWTAGWTLLCAVGAVLALIAFVVRERTAAEPMIDLRLLTQRTVRGSALLQTSVMVAMVGVGFASTQVFQFAWGWSPLHAGFGTLPMVAGMFAAQPIVDLLVERWGHRRAAAAGSVLLVSALVLLVVTMGHGYLPFGIGMFAIAIAMRVIMTTCAVELIDALPDDHTSIGSALNDTAQEVGNSIGVAVVGTVLAAALGTALPAGIWPANVTADFFGALHTAFLVLAGIVAVMGVIGVRTLSDSRSTEEH